MRSFGRVLAIVVLLTAHGAAWARICARVSPESDFDDATVVISGVIESASQGSIDRGGWDYHYTTFVFRVGQVWKGPAEHELRVSASGKLDRGVDYRIGGNYIVYAEPWRYNDLHISSWCGGLYSAHGALFDRVFLGSGTIVDSSIVVGPPSEQELVIRASSQDYRVADDARRALKMFREREVSTE